MLRNYFIIAWRNIVRSRFYSIVNIIGLSAGIAFALLIGAYIWSELHVNRQLNHAGNQYIIQSKWKDPNQGIELTSIGPLAKELKENYPGLVANYFRWDGITSVVSKGENHFREGIQICDSTLFQMYGFRLLQGNPKTAFAAPFSVVLTAAKARKYFGRTDVLGQTISIEDFNGSKHDFMIGGVLDNASKNSVTRITDDNDNEFYIPVASLGFFGRNMEWNNPYIVSYIQLQDGVNPKDLEKPMRQLVKAHAPPEISLNVQPYLVSLKEYHLSANNGLIRKTLYALSGIVFFILLMAVINFINLSVSRSATRMREIGLRKVMGGLKRQLVLQFLTESIVLVGFATGFAILVYALTRNLFSRMLGDDIPALSAFPVYFIAFPVVMVLVIGIVAGLYPAFVLSSLKSVESLKGKLSSVKDKVILRKSLVAFQFGTATIAFAGAFIITQQVRLFFGKDLGFNKDYLVSAALSRNWSPDGVRRMEFIRSQLAALPQVADVSLSYTFPDGGNPGNFTVYRADAGSNAPIACQAYISDEYFASTYTIPMAAGLFFSAPGAFTDSSKIVINETEARALGWTHPADAIGRQVVVVQGPKQHYTIAGVIKDFHIGSMKESVQPVTFLHVGNVNIYRFFTIKLKAGDIANAMNTLQKHWAALMPGTPFEYTFMDATLRQLYKTELQLKQAAYIAAALSLVIVLLGISGLVSLSVQKRTKEIGIRKVLGSSIKNIIALFLKELIPAILLAGLIAGPIAWILMKNWLSDYSRRVDITAAPFIVTILLLGAITTVLVTLLTVKTALTNPVKSLRTE